MARAGADILVPHMGFTTSGTIGARTVLSLPESVERVQAMRDAAVAVNPEIIVLCHGGPIAEPADVRHVLVHRTAPRRTRHRRAGVGVQETRPDRKGHPGWVTAAEVAEVISFLLQDSVQAIRGQSINVDGGTCPY